MHSGDWLVTGDEWWFIRARISAGMHGLLSVSDISSMSFIMQNSYLYRSSLVSNQHNWSFSVPSRNVFPCANVYLRTHIVRIHQNRLGFAFTHPTSHSPQCFLLPYPYILYFIHPSVQFTHPPTHSCFIHPPSHSCFLLHPSLPLPILPSFHPLSNPDVLMCFAVGRCRAYQTRDFTWLYKREKEKLCEHHRRSSK